MCIYIYTQARPKKVPDTLTYGLLNAVAIGDLTHLDVNFLALTAAASYRTIRRAHRHGMKVYAWTTEVVSTRL